MSRYIDADELMKKINEHECFSYDPEVSRICELINDAPTLDVVEVVCCKDCKYYLRTAHKCLLTGRYGIFENYYCNEAEREEQEDECDG